MITLDIKNILITGSTGYLGKSLYTHLRSRNYNVIGLHHKNKVKNQESVTGDLLDSVSLKKALKDIDCIVHCGALVGGNWPKKNYEVNSKGTGNLINMTIEMKVQKIIHISTLAVVDEYIDHFNDDESIPYTRKYRNHYTQSKIQAEKFVLENKHKINSVILRPGWIWGPGEKSFEQIVEMIKTDKFRFIGDGKNLTYFTYIENMTQIIELALKKDVSSGEIFNITDGEKITMYEFINKISNELSVKPVKRYVPVWAANTIAFFSEKLNPNSDLTRHNVSIMSNNLYFNIDKAKRIFGYKPMNDLSCQIRKCL